MNRLKVLVFALVAVAAVGAALFTRAGSERAAALAALDARLAAGAAHAAAALRTSQREAAAAAALVASDAALRTALAPKAEAPPLPRKPGRTPPPPPPIDPAREDAGQAAAAAGALAAVERTLGPLAEGRRVLAASAPALSRRPVGGDADALLRGAADGTARAAFARADGRLFAAAGAPAGEAAGAVVLVPVDDPWARAVSRAAGVEVTVAGTDLKPAGNAPPGDALALVAAATRAPGKAVDVGAMAPVDVGSPALPVALPKLGPLLHRAPAHRALAVPVEGLKGAVVVVSAAVGPALAPVVVLEWRGLALLVLLLLVGLVFVLLVRPSEIVPAVPEALVAIAAKIERGDFSARAPQLAGKLGTLAAALNRAAEAAEGSGGGAPSQGSSITQEFFAAPPPPPEAEPSAFEFPSRPPRSRPVEEPKPALSGDPFQAAPVGQAAPPPSAATPAAQLASAARAAPPPIPNATMTRTMPAVTGADDEATHWQQVFQDFVRTRAECGEPSEGLTYDRFRAKLESNKSTLVAKYQCRTVRFQVYVKDGKAALKATPVR